MSRLSTLLAIFILIIPSFGSSQSNIKQFPAVLAYPRVHAAAFQNDLKIIIAGDIVRADNKLARGIVRLNPNGSRDTSFNPADFLAPDSKVKTILVDKNGKILVAGRLSNILGLIRLNPDGSLDDTFNYELNGFGIINIWPYGTDQYLIQDFGGIGKQILRLNSNGSIDESFDVGTGPGGPSEDDLAVLPDGRIIYGGNFTSFNGHDVKTIVRLNPDGSIDHTFDSGPGFMGNFPRIRSVFLQEDGRIVLAGRFDGYQGVSMVNIVRLMPDGAIDHDFVKAAISTAKFNYDGIRKIIPFKGGILATGLRQDEQSYYYVAHELVKMNNDGSVDTKFNVPPMDIFEDSYNYFPVLAQNGDKVLFGENFIHVGTVDSPGLALLTETGDIDPNFKHNIRSRGEVNTIQLQADGKILIGGTFDYIESTRVRNLARFNTDHSLDISFQTNMGTGPVGFISELKLVGDNKILVGGGFHYFNDKETGQLIRLNADGTPDKTFLAFIPGSHPLIGTKIEQLPNEQILVAGYFYTVNNSLIYNIAKLNKDGSLDNSFNSSLLVPIPSGTKDIKSIFRQSNGNLLIAGESLPLDLFLLETNPDGIIIDDFSKLKLVIEDNNFSTIKELPNQNFIVTGHCDGNCSYLSTMPKVHQFSKDGKLLNTNSIVVNGEVNDIGVIDDQEILLGGDFSRVYSYNSSDLLNSYNSSGLMRIGLDGTILASDHYDVRGKVTRIYQPDKNKNKYFVGGFFSTINDKEYFSLVELDLQQTDVRVTEAEHGINQDIAPYPNPCKEKLIVTLSGKPQPTSVTVYNSVGTVLYSEINSIDKTEIDVRHYASGVYFVRLTTGNQSNIFKVFKQ